MRMFGNLQGSSMIAVLIALIIVAPSMASAGSNVPITQFGAVADGSTMNTKAIQSTIDHVASDGGGTVVVPKGVFLSGAVFLKPGVNLHLDDGAVFKGSTDIADFPKMRTRIEGHFEDWIPALVNADHCDHLQLTGPGTLDGSGQPYWDLFWAQRKADSNTKNLDVPRPRLCFIQNSSDVKVSDLHFKDSGFWNLHLYHCQDAVVENARFEVPNDKKCPSTDGTDIDSCQNVTIRGCFYSVNDDCIALKGSKGPFAMDDKESPPDEHIHVVDCTFERGAGVVTVGSEATIVRDVTVEKCKCTGPVDLVRLKLRPDTPQDYEDIQYRDITLDAAGGNLLRIDPWKQYFDLKGQPPPKSIVRNVTLTSVKGKYGSFGVLEGNPDTTIENITIENVDVTLANKNFHTNHSDSITLKNVIVNGEPFSLAK